MISRWGETPSNPDFLSGQDSRARRSLARPLDGFMVPRPDPGIAEAFLRPFAEIKMVENED